MWQLENGVEPGRVIFEKKLAVVWDHSVSWLVSAYEVINNCELVEKVVHLQMHLKSPF